MSVNDIPAHRRAAADQHDQLTVEEAMAAYETANTGHGVLDRDAVDEFGDAFARGLIPWNHECLSMIRAWYRRQPAYHDAIDDIRWGDRKLP